jgi:hypothetical protein
MAHGRCEAPGRPEFFGFAFGVCIGAGFTFMWSDRPGRALFGVRPLSERTYATNCQICSFVNRYFHEGIPFARPSAIEAKICVGRLP